MCKFISTSKNIPNHSNCNTFDVHISHIVLQYANNKSTRIAFKVKREVPSSASYRHIRNLTGLASLPS